ncbi:MAG: class I SAM-dependent methyltransferase [bacterium]|nr:class I SAM-dependent methyltransferase [bacterium]
MPSELEEKIRACWEDPDTRSLIDPNLRRLEEGVVLKYLEPGFELLDVGCGDGESTLTYARHVKRCLGIERSELLRRRAVESCAQAGLDNTEIVAGDVFDLDACYRRFDVAVTQRVIINQTSWEMQQEAIEQVRATLRPGGIYVMIENTFEGHDAINDWRTRLGLPKISRHWHNLYLHHELLMDYLGERFEILAHHTFDLYYLLTRIYANLFASFEGFGKTAKKDAIFPEIDAAARRLYDELGEQVAIGDGPAFGPIQGFVVRKISEDD